MHIDRKAVRERLNSTFLEGLLRGLMSIGELVRGLFPVRTQASSSKLRFRRMSQKAPPQTRRESFDKKTSVRSTGGPKTTRKK